MSFSASIKKFRGRGGVRLLLASALFTSFASLAAPLSGPVSAAGSAATVSASPLVAVPGERIAITASGFTPNEVIILHWDGQLLSGSDHATGSGTLTTAYAYVPMNASTGNHALTLTGTSSRLSAVTMVTVPKPELHEVPLSVTAGLRFRITGTGFGASEAITFTWDGVVLPDWHATTDAQGNFGRTYGHVPGNATVGQHLFVAHGQRTSRFAQVQLTVTAAKLHEVPLTVTPGQQFRITGTGFGANEAITFTWDGAVLPAWQATTDAQGNFGRVYGTVPSVATPGQHIFAARGQRTGAIAQVRVTVTSAALHEVPLSVTSHERFRITGTGFGASEAITFTWDGVVLPDWHATTDAQGNFGRTYGHVPGNATLGQHIFAARGQRTGAIAQVRITVVAR